MKEIIYKQDAIDALEREKTYSTAYKDGYTQTDYFKQYNMGLTDGIKALNKLPSAERKGKWIATKEWGGRNYSCSCCKFSFIVDTCMLEPMWNFCPNCGADMRGEENG